jgi:hypothetical protein
VYAIYSLRYYEFIYRVRQANFLFLNMKCLMKKEVSLPHPVYIRFRRIINEIYNIENPAHNFFTSYSNIIKYLLKAA